MGGREKPGGIEKLVKHLDGKEDQMDVLTSLDVEREFGEEVSKLIKKGASSEKAIVWRGYEIRVTSEFGAEAEEYQISLHERKFNWLPYADLPFSHI